MLLDRVDDSLRSVERAKVPAWKPRSERGKLRQCLSELAERTGVEFRTLRSWIQQGLVPGPDRVGRHARYAPAALTRARAVKAMRDLYGLPLASIRQDLLAADEDRIAAYAAMAAPAAAAVSRQISIGHFRCQILPIALAIHEQKQWGSIVPRSASRQYRIYSDGVDGARTGIWLNEELCQDGCR